MANSPRLTTTDLDTNTQTTRNVLLERNPHLRVNDTLSPFGNLGTRPVFPKNFMTPGSVTSASSFEEGTSSYDGFSDIGTPAFADYSKIKSTASVNTGPKQLTKKLSPPSRDTLARNLLTTSIPLEINDLSSNNLLRNVVIKTIPFIDTTETPTPRTTIEPVSPRANKVTRRIVVSPHKTLRRVVVRKRGLDGTVSEQVQYVNGQGQILHYEGSNAKDETLSESWNVSVNKATIEPTQQRRVVVHRTAPDGYVQNEVPYLTIDGTIARTTVTDNAKDVLSASGLVETLNVHGTTRDVSSRGQSRRVITRRVVTASPGKVLTRQTDGKVLDNTKKTKEGHVETEPCQFTASGGFVRPVTIETGSGKRIVTRRVVVTPHRVIRRKVLRSQEMDDCLDIREWRPSHASDVTTRREDDDKAFAGRRNVLDGVCTEEKERVDCTTEAASVGSILEWYPTTFHVENHKTERIAFESDKYHENIMQLDDVDTTSPTIVQQIEDPFPDQCSWNDAEISSLIVSTDDHKSIIVTDVNELKALVPVTTTLDGEPFTEILSLNAINITTHPNHEVSAEIQLAGSDAIYCENETITSIESLQSDEKPQSDRGNTGLEDAFSQLRTSEDVKQSFRGHPVDFTANVELETNARLSRELLNGVKSDVEVVEEQYIVTKSPLLTNADVALQSYALVWSNVRLNGSYKRLLDDVSGSVRAGEFLIITGDAPHESQALLSCLAGYEDAMEGNVTINGHKCNDKFTRYFSYVCQEDLFYETITVYEHLVYQAKLRLGRTHTDEMCYQRVEQLLEEMMLSNCRDTIIGGGISFDGISQGERKLLALATALLTKPAILLVEEPTAGLDTRSAESIVAKLRDLAHEQNMIVIGTLHRFSSHLYSLVDYLYLVADASCVYDGKAANAVAYFSSIGYPCPAYTSPMDYFMLQMAIDDGESDEESVARVALLKREWFERNALVYADNVAQARVACNDALLSDYEHKNRYRHMGCGNQIWLLWTRHVRRLSRYGYIFGRHLMATLLFGIIFGLVYLHVDINDENGIQNVVGLFFYIVVIQMLFMAFRAFIYLPRETALALRERQDYRGGWYYLLCWYVTKMAAELPALVAYSIALFAPVFVLVKIDEGFLIYVSMQIVVILAGWVAVALAFFVLSALRDATRALMVYVVIVTTFIVMGGFFLKVTNIPDYLLWLHYLSPVTFAYEAMMKIFWQQVKTIACGNTCVAHTGEQVLELYRLNSSRSALSNSLLLFAIGIVLYLATLCNLLLLATKKRHSTLQWRYDWKYTTLVHRKKRAFQNNVDTCHIKDGKCDVHNINQGVTGNFDKHYIQIETPRIESRSDVPRMTLGWQCTLIIKHALWKKQDTVVLDDASGLATCGELCLITGPSNTSNVALLKSLHGHSPAREFKGVITLNGVKSSFQQLSHYTAFVSSLNVFYETLTVIEHLHFQAFLTLSNPIHAIITERINRILEELELSCKRNTRISDLSHVYTKQLAIATALLQNPSIVLLETPTKHMNLVSSQRLILLLRQLARTGRTIIVTMNTPLSHQVALFDTLNLLIDGVTVFHGNVTEVVPFIASLGYECPFNWNPIDFFISILSKQDMTSEARRELRNRFKACGNYHLPLPHLNGFHDENEMWRTKELDVKRSKGFFLVVLMVLHRQFLVLIRCRCFYYWQAFWMLCLGLVVGLFFRQLDLDDQEDILNWTGAFYVLIVLQMMVNGTRTFVLIPYEWALMEYEPRYTQFVLFIWCCIKESTELVLLLVFSIILFVPAYLLMGIRHGFQLYFYMQLVLWMAGWSATGMATLVLGLVRHVRSAGFVFMIMLLFMATFGGLLIHVDDIPDYFSWVHYISPVKYGYEALMKLFWGRIGLLACNRGNASGSGSMAAVMVGDTFSHSMSSASYEKDSDCIARSGDDVLAYYSMDSSRNARSDCLILLSLSVVSIFIGYVALSLRWRWYKSTA